MKNKMSGLRLKKIVIFLNIVLIAMLSVNAASAVSNKGVVQLTTDKADDTYPAWSPDGSKIAFTSYRSGNADIWIMNSDGSNQKQLTTNKSNDIYSRWVNTASVVYKPNPRFGANVTYGGYKNNDLLFWSDRSGNPEIWRMSPNGSGQDIAFSYQMQESAPKQNINDWLARMHAISPTENKIAILWKSSIILKDVDADTDKILFSDNNFLGMLEFSPDGKKLAFVSSSFGNPDIWVINTDGTNLKQLTSEKGEDAFPAWSPDGSKIAFASNRNGNWDIWVMDSDGNNQQLLTSYSFANEFYPTWDPTGTKIAFTSGLSGNSDIWVMELSFDEKSPTTPRIVAKTAEAWYYLGNNFYLSNKYKEAIEAYEKAIAIDPNIPNIKDVFWVPKGRAHDQLGETKKAIEAYENAIRINLSDTNAWWGKGGDLYNLEKYNEAATAFREVTRISPDFEPGWTYLGAALSKQGKQDEANKAYAKADEIRKRSSGTAAPTATSAPQTPSTVTTPSALAPTLPLSEQEPNRASILILFSAIALVSVAVLFKPMVLKYYRWKMKKLEKKYDGTPLKKLKEVLGDEK